MNETRDIPADNRIGYIGGSDAPVILGLNKWKSRTQLYLEKRGEVEPDDLSDNQAVQWGHILEPVIANQYAKRTAHRVLKEHRLLTHSRFPFIGAHIDAITELTVYGAKRILECKSTQHADGWGEPGTDQIPDMHYAQVQHYLGVVNALICDVAVLIRGSDFRIYHVARNEDFIDALFSHEISFWECVQNGTPPEPTLNDEAALTYPSGKDCSIETDIEGLQLYEDLCEIREAEKDLKEQKDKIELELKKRIGDDADTLTYGGERLVSWKSQTSMRFDSKAFQKEHPDLYQSFKASSSSRVFRVSKRKSV